MKKIFISAGEPSGDIHAALLMRSIKHLVPDVEFIGIGGEAMAREGLESIVSISEISVVGFWEVAKKYSFFKKLLKQSKELLASEKVDMFLPVDYPGFNLNLADFAKQQTIPVVYYIAPQLWAWGKNRAKKLANRIDTLMVVFPFEVDFFSKFGINTRFVGHPLLDSPDFADEPAGFKERRHRVVFLPGSRKQEVIKHIPLIDSIAVSLSHRDSTIEIAIAKSKSVSADIYKEAIAGHKNLRNVTLDENARELMRTSKAGIVKTGTSTLEAALCGMPFSMIYKTSFLSYHLSRKLINLPYISLPNILANKFVLNEEIQNDINPEKIAADLFELMNKEEKFNKMTEEFKRIRKLLGEKGASDRAAGIVAEVLGEKNA